MTKSLKILIVFFAILIILIPSVFGMIDPSMFKGNISGSDVVPVANVAQKSLGIVQVFSNIIVVFLIFKLI